MDDQDKKKHSTHDSTTDFFLKVVKKEKETKTKETVKIENFTNTKNKTLDTVFAAYNNVNKILDKLLSNKISVMALSFILTIVLFLTLSGGDVLNSATSGTTLDNVPIIVDGLKDGYEVSGVPTKVKVGLIGPSLDIYTAKITNDYEVYIDLSDYGEGEHTVSLKSRNFNESLTVMLLPETVTIKISPKVNTEFKLGYRFINEDQLDEKYSVSLDTLDINKVTVTASQEKINKIAKVQACVDVGGKISSFTQVANIKAFDSEGRELDVDINPAKVQVNCNVDSYSKVVSIKPKFLGDLKDGYDMKNYILSESTVTIYGSRENLSEINTIQCDVDIDGLSGSTTLSGLVLKKAEGINKMSISTIDISMEIEKKK